MEVAVALLPVRERVARDRLHLHVGREEVVAAVRAVRRGLVDEQLGVVPLAHQPAVVIGEADDDGLDFAARRRLTQLVERQRTLPCGGLVHGHPPDPVLLVRLARRLVRFRRTTAQAGPRKRWRSLTRYHTPSSTVSAGNGFSGAHAVGNAQHDRDEDHPEHRDEVDGGPESAQVPRSARHRLAAGRARATQDTRE